MYQTIVQKLTDKKLLNQKEIQFFLSESIAEHLTDEQKGEILVLFQEKGVQPEELSIFADLLLAELPTDLNLPEAVDICGTGGSGLIRINTSTISAFILAACDIKIAKHGNKAASGRFGSFDLLENMGINIDTKPEILSYAFWKENLAFLFARSFHPVMKHFVKVRQELGQPTLFNTLGPLISPVNAKYQIIGTAFEDKMELIAETAQKLGKEKVMVVRGSDGLDEITLTGPTQIIEIVKTSQRGVSTETKLKKYEVTPADFGLKPCAFEEIAGGDAKFNTKIAESILRGECKTRHLDLVLINAAAILKMMDKVKTWKEGYQIAKEAIKSGKAYQKFEAYRDISTNEGKLYEITGNKYQELVSQKEEGRSKKQRKQNKIVNPVLQCGGPREFGDRDNKQISNTHQSSQAQTPPSFKKALEKPGLNIICEIKKHSPSQGKLGPEDADVVKIAKLYEEAGASAISVLTDKKYFGGTLKDMQKVTKAVDIPVLRKDFIIDASQIYEAASAGASAILLIAAVLETEKIEEFISLADKLGLDCLVEVHTEAELEKVLQTKAQIIGINNRDLKTLKIDLKNTEILAPHIPSDKIIISESGIESTEDIKKLPRKINGILVGTSFMRVQDENIKMRSIRSFKNAKKIFKACGIRKVKDAEFCEMENVDMIGLNFVPTSKRCIDEKLAEKIRKKCIRTKVVGVFQNQSLSFINKTAKNLNLDFIQLAGEGDLDFIKKCTRPVIKTIKLQTEKDIKIAKKIFPHCAFIIFDGKVPGSGELSPYEMLKNVDFPYLLAGGITTDNVVEIKKEIDPWGFDTASGIEKGGKVSLQKIRKFLELF